MLDDGGGMREREILDAGFGKCGDEMGVRKT